MGGRCLRGWLVRPLVTLERIQDRLDAVEEFAFHAVPRAKFRELLKNVGDLERLVARVSLGSAGPRDLVAIRESAEVVPRVRTVLTDFQGPLISSLLGELDDLADLRVEIEKMITDDPPAQGGSVHQDWC